MAATADYGLSDLPDNLLRRILRFVPAMEGAATAVLSRRWRSLWRTSSAVNLDTRSYERKLGPLLDDAKREAFVSGAMAALAAATVHGPVTRLSFHVDADDSRSIEIFVHHGPGWPQQKNNMIHGLIADPATRHVEELRIAGVARKNSYGLGGYYDLGIHVLPCEALCVLHIVHAKLELDKSDASVSFPRLNSLHLHGCDVSLKGLRAMIQGAPQLSTVRLESIYIESGRCSGDSNFCQIQGQEITALVLTDWNICPSFRTKISSIELDIPKLRYFRFDGVLSDNLVSLKSWPQSLTRVDLYFKDSIYQEDIAFLPFWHMLRNLHSTKVLKLKVDYPINRMAVVDMKSLDELLENKLLYNLERLELEGCYTADNELLDNKLLYNLERLEVEGCCDPEQNTAGKAIANLLHCFPILRDLQLKINKASHTDYYTTSDMAREAQSDFDKSVKHFRRRRGTCGSNDDKYEVSDIPGLSEHIFNCLQSHLRRLSLQFYNEEDGFFEVQLLKFFAENAMVLEEVQITDGNRKMCEHLNDKFRTWALNSAERISLQKAFLESLPMYSVI